MSFYFQVQPQGLGTAEVECLSSYLHRLAHAHGASFHQFMEHLRHWRLSTLGQPLSRHDSIRYNGYSREVPPLLETLQAGTGLANLAGCTLIALRDVCAGNAVGALKGTRAWCAACYRQAERNSDVVYDRLYWQIQGISRCSIHSLELSQRCGACEAVQRNNSGKTALSLCERCGESLAVDSGRLAPATKQDAVASQAEALLAYTSSSPISRFRLAQLGEFTSTLLTLYPRRVLVEHFGELFHKRYSTLRLQLGTLLDLAAKLNISIVDILTDGSRAASQMAIPFDLPARKEPVLRPRSEKERRERALELLEEATKKGPPYPPLASIIALADIPPGSVFYHRKDAFAAYGALRRKHAASVRKVLARRIIRLAKASSAVRTLATAKARHKWLAVKTGASISVVRKILDAERRRNLQAIDATKT